MIKNKIMNGKSINKTMNKNKIKKHLKLYHLLLRVLLLISFIKPFLTCQKSSNIIQYDSNVFNLGY